MIYLYNRKLLSKLVYEIWDEAVAELHKLHTNMKIVFHLDLTFMFR